MKGQFTAPGGRLPSWLTVLGLLLLPFVVYLPATLVRGVFFFHDVQYYWYPYHALSARLIESGELPLWNPGAFSGIPFVGDGQNALFYPTSWLFFLFSPDRIFNHIVILQFSLGGLAMYACLRELALRRDAAILGAVSFMFCGFLTARALQLSIMASASLVPLVFFTVHRFYRLRSLRWFALAGIAIALQVLTGHPQVPIYTGVAMLGFALLVGWDRRRRGEGNSALWRAPAQLVAMYLFGYAVGAVQLWPWFELARESPRAAGASFFFLFRSSTSPYDWLLLLFPYAFGSINPGPFSDGGVPLSSLGSRLWEHSIFIGILPLALACLTGWQVLAQWRRRRAGVEVLAEEAGLTPPQQQLAGYFVVVVLATMALACGKYTPLSQLLYHTPVVGKFRDVERFMALGDFALAGLAAMGLHGLGALAERRGRAWQRRMLVIAGLLVAVPITVTAVLSLPAVAARARQDLTGLMRFDRANALVPIGCALVTAAIFWWLRRHAATTRVRAGLCALVVAEMGFFAASFNPLTDPDLFRRPPDVLSAFKTSEPFRKATFIDSNDFSNDAAKELLAVSWGMPYGIDDMNGFNSLQPRRYTDYVFGPEVEDVAYGKLTDPKLLRRESPILSSLNVRYLLVPREQQLALGAHFVQRHQNQHVTVYENQAAYPRAFFPERWEAASDRKQVLATVTADGFGGQKRALVEGTTSALPAPATGAADVKLDAWGASRQRLTATTTAARLLVTSEMFFPGWTATIDGQPAPILRANYLFRAVVVPPGKHVVEFRYQPSSLRFGALITALALAVAALFITRFHRPGRAVDTRRAAA